MSLLTADIGNTQTHIGMFDGDGLLREWRASTDPSRTADELALLFGQFLELGDLTFRDVTGVALCSVVPRATQEAREMVERYFGFPALVVGPGIKTGIAVRMDNPREVGADRIANAVAAHAMFAAEPVVVVDFGTAITVDAVSADGSYLGGAIAPGIDTAAAGLYAATAQLRRVELVAPPDVIGKSTVQAVQSGLVYGFAGMVDGLVAGATKELGGDARVVATGGLAPTVIEHCHRIERFEPMLTLLGLKLIYERNQA
ncbi:MAG TPA: type III pantothenate kinase [Actinomycetota bacterium]|nr:type III pantothenate kinase [Actinomycetota bacterium]